MSTLDQKRKEKNKTKKRTSRKAKRRLRIIRFVRDIILILLVVVLSIGGYNYFYAVFADEPVAESEEDAVEVTVRVDSGMSEFAVARMLKKNGLVDNAFVFFGQTKIFKDSGSQIQPGTYQLNTYMTGQEIIEVLTGTEDDESEDE